MWSRVDTWGAAVWRLRLMGSMHQHQGEGGGAKKQLHLRIDRGALNTQTEGRLDRQSDGWKMDDGGNCIYLCEIVVTGSAPVFW